MRLQGATLIEPDVQLARIRLSDKTSRLHPRRVVPKPHTRSGRSIDGAKTFCSEFEALLEGENNVFRLLVGLTSAICAAMLAPFAIPTFAAPSQGACSIMTKDEVKQFSSNRLFDQIPLQEEKVGQGSVCSWPGVYVQIDPFPVATLENMRRQPGQTLEAAPGIGDAAFLRDNRGRYAELAGRVGQRVFTIQMTIGPGETYASVKPRLLRMGTAMVAKLRWLRYH